MSLPTPPQFKVTEFARLENGWTRVRLRLSDGTKALLGDRAQVAITLTLPDAAFESLERDMIVSFSIVPE